VVKERQRERERKGREGGRDLFLQGMTQPLRVGMGLGWFR